MRSEEKKLRAEGEDEEEGVDGSVSTVTGLSKQ
jgi:hypothetical protein